MARRRRIVKVVLSDEEYAVVAGRAASHRRRVATFARTVLLGEQAKAERDADEWWDALPPSRRAQVHQWVSGRRGGVGPIPGQDDLPLEGLSA